MSLRPHGLQHARLPCPSLSPEVYSDSCPLSWWCPLTISSSASPFSFCLQSFPVLGSFPMSWCLASGDQSIGVLASATVLPMNIQGWFSLGLTGLISLQLIGLARVFSGTTIWNHHSSVFSFLYGLTLTSIHDCWKNHSFDYIDLCQQSNQDAWVRGCKGFGNFWEGVSDEPIIKIFKIAFSNRLVIEVQIVSLQTLGSSRWYHVQP